MLTRGLDLLLWGLGAVAWGLAVFALSSRFIDSTLGGLLGLAVATSGIGYVLATHLHDNRMESLTGGFCPRCRAAIEMEHRHRRWDPGTRSWASPSTAWDCRSCSFSHAESWPCPQCPAAQ